LGIRGQLTLLIPTVIAVALVSLAFYATEEQRLESLDAMRVRGQQALVAVGITAAVDVAQNDVAALDTLVAHVAQSGLGGDLLELEVLDEKGRVLAHSVPSQFNHVRDDPFTKVALAADEPVWQQQGQRLRIAVPAKSGLRWATVSATYSLEGHEAGVRRFRNRWLMTAFAVWFVIGLTLFLGMDRLVVSPVKALQHAVRKMGEGKLTTRAQVQASKEFKELAEVVNGMAQKLAFERDNLESAVKERTAELQDANDRLEKLAVTDGLTGLYNHRRFQESLAAELKRSERSNRPLSLLMWDVDLFKRVNDAMGHPRGDELLRRLAQVLTTAKRQTDLLARYGGEEFAVLLPETSKTEAVAVAERMRAAVEQQLNFETAKWGQTVTVSGGIATWPEDGKTAEEVLIAADQALYVAKRQGRNRVIQARAA
jgi:diguanylate cyclase (GGDEF)-like protein